MSGDLDLSLIGRCNQKMTNLFLLKPEVAGGLGPSTVISNYREIQVGEALVPSVTKLEYVFDDWLGDSLITTFPCFVVTRTLAERIEAAGLSGALFSEVIATKSDLFNDIHDEDEFILPEFVWLQPSGRVKLADDKRIQEWSGDDVSITQRADLIVSAKCLEILRQGRLNNCEVIELSQ